MSSTDRVPTSTANVVLTGFMGTGKTTVGRLLAARLAAEFVDTDHMIEAQHGPIAVIFAEQGEDVFRSIEREIAGELGQRRNLVIATGGRLMLDPINAEVLGASGRVFCLSAPIDVIIERVVGDGATQRPLLDHDDPAELVRRLLAERAERYGRFEQVDTNGRDPNVIVDDIVDRLGPAPDPS